MVVFIPAMSAFEAHVVGVTASIAAIDAPIFDPSGSEISGPTTINITSQDPDATHIFYSLQEGTNDPSGVSDPFCGGNGGAIPQNLNISKTSVIKAIACDGSDASSHSSLISTQIYTFVAPPQEEEPPILKGPETPGDTLPEAASDVAQDHAQNGLNHPNSTSTPGSVVTPKSSSTPNSDLSKQKDILTATSTTQN